jgi:hypothetical protein
VVWYELLEHIQLLRVDHLIRFQQLGPQLECLVNSVLRAAVYDGEVGEARVRRHDGRWRYGAVLLCVRMRMPAD